MVLLMWRGAMWGAVDKVQRAYPPGDCECGILAVGVPIGDSRSRKAREGGSLRIIPGPPLAVALATTQEGKSKRSAEGGPQSPFR